MFLTTFIKSDLIGFKNLFLKHFWQKYSYFEAFPRYWYSFRMPPTDKGDGTAEEVLSPSKKIFGASSTRPFTMTPN